MTHLLTRKWAGGRSHRKSSFLIPQSLPGKRRIIFNILTVTNMNRMSGDLWQRSIKKNNNKKKRKKRAVKDKLLYLQQK